MSHVYLAAKYARRFELRFVRSAIEAHGHKVTSRWIDNEDGDSGAAAKGEGSPREAAVVDLVDVDDADTLIFFGEPAGTPVTGGGRWFEFGYALAKGKRCIAITKGIESIFTELPQVIKHNTIEQAIQVL